MPTLSGSPQSARLLTEMWRGEYLMKTRQEIRKKYIHSQYKVTSSCSFKFVINGSYDRNFRLTLAIRESIWLDTSRKASLRSACVPLRARW